MAVAVPRINWMQHADILVSIGVVSVLIMMVVPLPPPVVSFFICTNLLFAVIILLLVMYTDKAIEFSVFPSLLLITTVYRLALNVSSTRLILLGRGEEIGIVRAFGTFVVGGNYVVGFVIFLILVMIQFFVITRGTIRVSEVAARFTLDAMPGKQMAVDADLNAGLITEEEARRRRMEIRKEADFYGAMDGAAKFVQGDVIAGLIITIINIIGGLILGIVIQKLAPVEAARVYTMLTVGDGLVSQIPALLVSVATGLIVTRAAEQSNLGGDIVKQFANHPKVWAIAAAAVGALGLFTPLPTLPLLALSAIAASISYAIRQGLRVKQIEEEQRKRKEEQERARRPESVVGLLHVDPMELEIGYSLIPLVDPEAGGDLLDRITMIRRQAALDLGLLVPPIRIRDNMQLKPNAYVIKIKGTEIARGTVKVDHYLAMDPGTATEKIEGEQTKEPAFGLPAIWITEDKREAAERAGYTVVDPPSVIATHLAEVIRRNAYKILGRQDTQTILDNLKATHPALVDEVLGQLSLGIVQKVFALLLKEGVSIRDTVTILESLADAAASTKDPYRLTEYARRALSMQITNQHKEADGTISCITVAPELEKRLEDALQQTDEGPYIVLDPGSQERLIANLAELIKKAATIKYEVLLLCSSSIRLGLRRMLERHFPQLFVLSYNEIASDVQIKSVGVLRV